jgi:hypothetical protein
VDPISVPPVVAPERSRSPATSTAKLTPWIEHHVGECVAAAASVILQALDEHRDGGLIPRTKEQIGDSVWQVYRLRQFLVPTWDFDVIAREQGVAALRTADVAPAIAQIAVEEVIRVLHAVIRETLN